MYDMPSEIDVQADGPLRIITLNRPDSLNSVNDDLHHGLAKLWQRMSDDLTARAAVITGAGRAFSAGGDFAYLAELAGDADLRAKTIADLFKFRYKVGLDVAMEALRDGLKGRRTTRDEIMRYARICRVAKVMQPYLESEAFL